MLRNKVIKFLLRNSAAMGMVKSFFSNRFIANNSLYKKYSLKKAREYANLYPCGVMGANIETTLNCNAKCVMCYHGVKHLSGSMSMDLFSKIVDDYVKNNITSIGLSVYGEPLMDKYFFERIEYLRRYKLNYSFFSNGYLLDKEKTDRLFELGGLEKVNFSVCGYEDDVYEKVMVGLKRNTTYENILYFLELKEKLKQDKPMVVISTVKTYFNRKDLRKFIKFWKHQKGADYIIVADLWDRVGEENINKIGKIGRMHRGDRWLAPCEQIWSSVYIYFDGRVSPCCDDNDLRRLIIGDMNKQTLREIYCGKEMQNLRKLHLEDKRCEHKICDQCKHNYVWISGV